MNTGLGYQYVCNNSYGSISKDVIVYDSKVPYLRCGCVVVFEVFCMLLVCLLHFETLRTNFDVFSHVDTMSEWLRRWIRNPLGSARAGSNPVGVDPLFAHLSITYYSSSSPLSIAL